MKNYLKVLDHEFLYRDQETGAIINTNKSIDSNSKINTTQVLRTLHSDVECLKNELSEIKNLLRELVKNA
jgi:hypothetical protein